MNSIATRYHQAADDFNAPAARFRDQLVELIAEQVRCVHPTAKTLQLDTDSYDNGEFYTPESVADADGEPLDVEPLQQDDLLSSMLADLGSVAGLWIEQLDVTGAGAIVSA